MKKLFGLLLALPLAGCISFSSTETETETLDYAGFCDKKETQCREICGAEGIQTFSCKAVPREGLDFKCECKRPASKTI